MTYPITDDIKKGGAPHTFRVSTGINLTDANAVYIAWKNPSGVGHEMMGTKTATPSDGIIEWTDSGSFWTDGGMWYGEARVQFGSEKLPGDTWVTPITEMLF